MNIKAKAIRPFIGSKNFEISRNFYQDLGFEEVVLFHNMSLFTIGNFGFYLQDAYVKDWVDNTMVFMEVEDLDQFWKDLDVLNLPAKYEGVRTVPIQRMDWGSECFVHDPSGILWHFGVFAK
ncbi:MAG: glyoxalase [Saprospiraceae bacterium]|nr:glyoxalase [Saprospiraceae bacterium]